MTHDNIYTKFLIEYDKANVTSSYPSLTLYEVATILDKSYLALISLKYSGNNPRRAPFEYDVKSIVDLQPLVTNADLSQSIQLDTSELNIPPATNVYYIQAPEDFLYPVDLMVRKDVSATKTPMNETTGALRNVRYSHAQIVTHDIAKTFFQTDYNMPWIKVPVYYIENNYLCIVYDPIDNNGIANEDKSIYFKYIRKPLSFVENIQNAQTTEFECSDYIAEELISLAIVFALENVESARLNTKLNTRELES